MSKQLFYELGDIIKINAPPNKQLDNKIFYIDYLDNERIRLLNVDTLETTELLIHPGGNLRDETIESIEIYSKSKEKGYARLNNLLPEIWVKITVGGDAPFILIGKITDLEEDMIEIEEYPSNDKMYIDFGYKGIPLNIPNLQIEIRKPPKSFAQQQDEQQEDEQQDQQEDQEERDDTTIQDRLVEEELEQILLFDEEEEDEIEIEQIVVVPEEKRRYDIDTQMTNLLDERLSVIPNKHRTKEIINELHIEIERFKQLRMMFSMLDDNGIPGEPLRLGENYKPLAKKLYQIQTPIYWVIPIVKNNKKLYDIDQIEKEDIDNVVFLDSTTILTQQHDIYNQYLENINGGERNKYESLIQNLNPLYTPFESTEEQILITKEVRNNFDVIVNNDDEFQTLVAHSSSFKKNTTTPDNHIEEKKYYTDRYNIGLTHLRSDDVRSYNAITNRIPLTQNDNINLNGFLFFPKSVMHYSKIYLPDTSILKKCNLHHISFNYWDILRSNTITTQYPTISEPVTIIDKNFRYEKNTLLKQCIELTINIDEFGDEFGYNKNQRYKEFTEAIIPTITAIFELIKDDIVSNTSLFQIIKYLEPFSIYYRDIALKEYIKFVSFVKKNIARKKKEYYINSRACNRYSKTNSLTKLKKWGFMHYITPELLELYNIQEGLKKFENIFDDIIKLDNGRYLFTKLSLENINLHTPTDVDKIVEDSLNKVKQEIETKKETNSCKNYILTKVYMTVDELIADDNTEDVFYDKKYDPTRYSILDEFREQQQTLPSTEFKTFFTNSSPNKCWNDN